MCIKMHKQNCERFQDHSTLFLLSIKKIKYLFQRGIISVDAIHGRTREDRIHCALVFLSLVAIKARQSKDGLARIHSDTIITILGSNYSKFIQLLQVGTLINGDLVPVIIVDKSYEIGEKCKGYRLNFHYDKCGFELVQVTSVKAIEVYQKIQPKLGDTEEAEGVLVDYMNSVQSFVELPSREDVEVYAMKLFKKRYTKKNKFLFSKRLTKKSARWFLKYVKKLKTVDTTSDELVHSRYQKYVIDVDYHLLALEQLRQNGYRKASYSRYGKDRAYDSFTNMVEFIRHLLLIEGSSVVEVDFVNLHWHILVSLVKMNLTDDEIEFLNGCGTDIARSFCDEIDRINEFSHEKPFGDDWTRNQLKQGLLVTFNNMNFKSMNSPLFRFLEYRLPTIADYIRESKISGNPLHEIFFQIEGEIMAECADNLQKMNIKALYLFDGWISRVEDRERVRILMDEIAFKHGIYTEAKYKLDGIAVSHTIINDDFTYDLYREYR